MHVSMKQQDSLLLLVAGRRSYSMGSHQLMACDGVRRGLLRCVDSEPCKRL